VVESNGMDPMIKEQHKVVWIFHLHIHGHGCVAYTLARSTIVGLKKVNSVLCERRGANNWGGWCFWMHFEYSSPFCRSQSKDSSFYISCVQTTHTHTHKSEQLLT
jgi:hypothetical protein